MIIRTLLYIIFISVLTYPQKQNDKHQLFTKILSDYVINGLVNYKDLKVDIRLQEYLNQLANADPQKIESEKEQLAFWINAYNAYTLKIICDAYPIESINEIHSGGRIISHIFGSTAWDKDIANVNNTKLTLNNIEHEIIRKNFNEPRIHFALVCASISCPKLRNEAFEGHKLDKQLEEQAITFFNDETKNRFDIKNKVVYLSKILNWYDDDFGENDEQILLYIGNFLSRNKTEQLKNYLYDFEIEYMDYDWGLNDSRGEKSNK
ncbi:MAG: DUF547 domain-containing protein [Ignavibacteria bacterium]|nr:DUF547 domain-containing protein [Ignavibacteria bacterium]